MLGTACISPYFLVFYFFKVEGNNDFNDYTSLIQKDFSCVIDNFLSAHSDWTELISSVAFKEHGADADEKELRIEK